MGNEGGKMASWLAYRVPLSVEKSIVCEVSIVVSEVGIDVPRMILNRGFESIRRLRMHSESRECRFCRNGEYVGCLRFVCRRCGPEGQGQRRHGPGRDRPVTEIVATW